MMKNLFKTSADFNRQTGKSYSSDLHSKNNSILFSPQNFTTMEKSYKSNGITPHQTELADVQNSNSRKETLKETLNILILIFGASAKKINSEFISLT